MNDTNIKIKIDIGTIPILVKHKKILKLYCFYLTLKCFDKTNSGYLDYNLHKKELLKVLNMSEKTFYNRLNNCLKINVLESHTKGVKLPSFNRVADIFNLNHKKEFIEIEPNEIALEYSLRAKAIQLNLINQNIVVNEKIKKHFKIKDYPPEQIRLNLLNTLIKCFIFGTINNHVLPSNINPDITISQKNTSLMFGCVNQSSGCYWQKKLSKFNLLEMENRTIESKKYCNETRLIGKVSFNKKTNSKFMQLRNLIKVL